MKIEICTKCDGLGKTKENSGTHHSEYEYVICTKCNGTGRVKTNTYSYSVPFNTDNSIIRKFDVEISDLIRRLMSM